MQKPFCPQHPGMQRNFSSYLTFTTKSYLNAGKTIENWFFSPKKVF